MKRAIVAAGLLLLPAVETSLAAGGNGPTFSGGLKINADVEVVPASFNAKSGIGVLGGGIWNELDPMNGTVTNWMNLVDAISGNPTDVSLACTARDSFNANGSFGLDLSSVTDGLLGDYIYIGPGTITFTIKGLDPQSSYNLVVYCVGGSPGQAAIATGAVAGTTSATTASSFILGNNYLQNDDAIPDANGALEFRLQNTPQNNFVAFNGFQLQQNANLSFERSDDQHVVVKWRHGSLLEAATPTGPWIQNSAAVSPYVVFSSTSMRYFQVEGP